VPAALARRLPRLSTAPAPTTEVMLVQEPSRSAHVPHASLRADMAQCNTCEKTACSASATRLANLGHTAAPAHQWARLSTASAGMQQEQGRTFSLRNMDHRPSHCCYSTPRRCFTPATPRTLWCACSAAGVADGGNVTWAWRHVCAWMAAPQRLYLVKRDQPACHTLWHLWQLRRASAPHHLRVTGDAKQAL
jgi:hypothetical protein